MALFVSVSATFDLPPGLLSSVCFIESSYRVNVIHHDDGNENSVGVCQIQVTTARSLGFRGTERDLLVPATNTFYAGKYLRKQLDRYHNDFRKAAAAYNAGSYRERSPGIAKNQKYVKKVFAVWGSNTH